MKREDIKPGDRFEVVPCGPNAGRSLYSPQIAVVTKIGRKYLTADVYSVDAPEHHGEAKPLWAPSARTHRTTATQFEIENGHEKHDPKWWADRRIVTAEMKAAEEHDAEVRKVFARGPFDVKMGAGSRVSTALLEEINEVMVRHGAITPLPEEKRS